MKKIKIPKRIIACLLVLTMFVTNMAVPVTSYAAEETKSPETYQDEYLSQQNISNSGTNYVTSSQAGVLEKSIINYHVSFNVVDQNNDPIPSPQISVQYFDDWDYEYYDVSPEADGSYIMDKYTEYSYTVSAAGYPTESVSSYTPSGEEENIVLDIVLAKPSPEQEKVNAIKAKFDDELGALRPKFKEVKNIVQMVQDKLQTYTDLDTSNVTVSLETTEDAKVIAEDGAISYVTKDELTGSTNVKNVKCTFSFQCGNAKAVTGSRSVTIGWDQDYFNAKIAEESKLLTADKILGENKDVNEVTSDLILPRCMGESLQKVWSVAEWTSSAPEVIALEKPSVDAPIYPLIGRIIPQEQDTEVTLTAVFKANDTLLNKNVEKTEDFVTVPVEFKVIVKGTGPSKPTEEELSAILDQYYTKDLLMDAVTGQVIDTDHVTGDILLPRYTKIKDQEGKFVFANKEIAVSVDNTDVITINGYRAKVDIFQPADANVNLNISFTREGVTVTKNIPLKVIMVTDEELDAEIEMMNQAVQHYFDGINNGINESKDNVVENLHAFSEMRLDAEGNPVWIYNASEMKNDGIMPDSFFEDPWEMEGAGYNRFKSSEPEIIKHDNLLVTRPEATTTVEISSLLSSEKYGKFAPLHPDNEKLQKLYKQPVKVMVTVKGSKAAVNALAEAIDSAKQYLAAITEGTNPGEFPVGTKAALEKAIQDAQAVKDDPQASESDMEQAAAALKAAVSETDKVQNPQKTNVTIQVNKDNKVLDQRITAEVKSDEAEKAGYYKSEEYKNKITIADAMVVLHREMYGEAFDKDPKAYMEITNQGFITKVFGINTYSIGYLVNGAIPYYEDSSSMASVANDTVLKEGDRLTIFIYASPAYEDKYLEFEQDVVEGLQGEDITLTLTEFMPGAYPPVPKQAAKGYTVKLTSTTDENVVYEAVTDEEGKAVFNVKEAGTFKAEVTEGAEYFMAPYGEVKVNANTVNEFKEVDGHWYYYDENGVMVTGWKVINNMWFYFEKSGVMVTGWLNDSGNWYYFSESGAMVFNWQYINGQWYYFNRSGAMITGWLNDGGNWYYFNGSGAMVFNWQYINGQWYYFNRSGVMVTGWLYDGGQWYYFNGSGAMVFGWQYINGSWYYFNDKGAMAADQYVGSYYVNHSGAWVQ